VAEFLPQDAILGLQVFNRFLLLAVIHPARANTMNL